jgi:hypothetical protein
MILLYRWINGTYKSIIKAKKPRTAEVYDEQQALTEIYTAEAGDHGLAA